jgi:5,10-methylene-tetrahydrofolate dehydrogenase/methenyl tetrahydrofolate cyclohydrolase
VDSDINSTRARQLPGGSSQRADGIARHDRVHGDFPTLGLEGQVALLTVAAGGVGRATAALLLAGWRLPC